MRRPPRTRRFAASILPICKRPTVSFARTRRCRCRPSISARSSTTTTRRSPTCPITTSSRASSCPAPASCSTARANASRRCSRRISGGNGSRSATFRNTSRRRSSRPRTSASIATEGSTITQQIVKNLLVGEDLTYDRKIREMIVASRVEHTLSKAEILELYLNSVYLGRGSWGIELAARSYFGKQAKNLTLEEGALLAALTKGPNYFNPDRHPGRAQERLAYVFSRMQED